MTVRALSALLRARLYFGRRIVLYSCAAAAVAGALGPPGPGAALLCCSLLGTLLALDQSPGRYPHLDRCEQSAPLFGRELARAKALVPCVVAILTVAIYACAQWLRRMPDVPVLLAVVPIAVIACTLTALSATIRLGATRALYIVLAWLTSAAAYAISIQARAWFIEPAFCLAVSYVALRQYGEALARFDPI